MKNLFSIDLEDWYVDKVFKRFKPIDKNEQILDSIRPLVELLDKYKIRATFFVIGSILEEYPYLVKDIYDKGHEIASHGYSHSSLDLLGKEKFDTELKKSKKLIYKIIKERPMGFRAPNFSLNKKTLWLFDILKRNHFKYDSSLFPFKSRYYGIDIHLNKPFIVKDKYNINSDIKEFPIPIIKILKIPFIINGGFYLRFYPLWFIKSAIKHLNKEGVPANVFIHPWETYDKTPRVDMGYFGNFVSYYGIKNCLKKLEYLFKRFEFGGLNI